MIRGLTAVGVIGSAMALLCLLSHFNMVHAATYVVGGDSGWDFDVSKWPIGNQFKAGDILVFNYATEAHNVVVVDKNGYDSCTISEGSKTYNSGHDEITLVKGHNYFICGVPGHCLGFQMKIDVNAL